MLAVNIVLCNCIIFFSLTTCNPEFFLGGKKSLKGLSVQKQRNFRKRKNERLQYSEIPVIQSAICMAGVNACFPLYELQEKKSFEGT